MQRFVANGLVVQRDRGDSAALAEEKWAVVGAGQTITFTRLAAGCMAVTVYFQGAEELACI